MRDDDCSSITGVYIIHMQMVNLAMTLSFPKQITHELMLICAIGRVEHVNKL